MEVLATSNAAHGRSKVITPVALVISVVMQLAHHRFDIYPSLLCVMIVRVGVDFDAVFMQPNWFVFRVAEGTYDFTL